MSLFQGHAISDRPIRRGQPIVELLQQTKKVNRGHENEERYPKKTSLRSSKVRPGGERQAGLMSRIFKRWGLKTKPGLEDEHEKTMIDDGVQRRQRKTKNEGETSQERDRITTNRQAGKPGTEEPRGGRLLRGQQQDCPIDRMANGKRMGGNTRNLGIVQEDGRHTQRRQEYKVRRREPKEGLKPSSATSSGDKNRSMKLKVNGPKNTENPKPGGIGSTENTKQN